MSTQLSKLINALAKNSKTHKKKNSRSGNRRGRTLRAMPAAYAAHVRPRFNIISRSDRHCVVSGCDLIYKIPATLNSNGDAIFSVITANPAYWKGTRIGRIAPAYQTYRPISFKVSYIPQVAVTQSGTVFMGTLWDMAPPLDNLQQTLLTSNGGQLTQCYIPADSTVSLGRNLQQNLFKISGSLDTDTNPFIFCVGVAGANIIPGYLYVTYRYELRNPIGDSWTFINSGITTVSSLPIQDNTANGSIILMNQVATLGPGTILDRESGASQFFYHGSQIDLPEQTSVIYLNNFQTNTNTAARNISLPDAEIGTFLTAFAFTSPSTKYSFNEMQQITELTTFTRAVVVFLNVNTNQYSIGFFRTSSGVITIPETMTENKIWIYETTNTSNSLNLYEESGIYVTIPKTSYSSDVTITPNQTVRLPITVRIENLPL